jgi:hypothetical protein
MRRSSVFLPALTALLAPVGAGASPAQDRAVAPAVVFRDAAGDAGTAADIATVRVSNDDQGRYTFDIGFATPYPADGGVKIYLDTDLNRATGDPQARGADYVLSDDNAQGAFSFLHWSRGWKPATAKATVSDSLSADGRALSLSVGKSELGNSAGFDLRVESVEGDGSAGHRDLAPSVGSWRYGLQQLVRLSYVGGHSLFARAGGTWSVLSVVNRSDTGRPVGPEGRIACRANSGSTQLALARRYFTGSDGGARGAVCTFDVPLQLRNRELHATITVSYRGQSVTHGFSTRVR